MYRKLDALRGLPILRLHPEDAPVPVARLRNSPGEGRVSTIEAIAHALRLLEGDEPAAGLERLFAVAVERAQSAGRRIG
jgi:DTW domain-containing protein YfiP